MVSGIPLLELSLVASRVCIMKKLDSGMEGGQESEKSHVLGLRLIHCCVEATV